MLSKANSGVQKTLTHLESEFAKLQVGRANPALVEDILVESYGSMQAIKNIASVGVLDSQTLTIKPWDKNVIGAIGKAITAADLGLNPQNMADSIIIKIPALTEERRLELSKVAKKFLEEAKISIRNVRQEIHKDIKRKEDGKEISEDEAKDIQDDLQKIIDEANKKAEELYKSKEVDIMKL
ncbi:ribosome recycling factor [Candidatus Gracilibacteria bacterium]|nr:MAG: ribosome recycling factor [Candidatus Gracilibacteria bacterium]PIE85613.1 MAG: ribosome recycling factor [Candidatus Gracilibacteria bacterium]